MRWLNRKTRLAVVLAVVIVAAVVAWRTGERGGRVACKEDRVVEKDSGGKITKITRTHCLSD